MTKAEPSLEPTFVHAASMRSSAWWATLKTTWWSKKKSTHNLRSNYGQ